MHVYDTMYIIYASLCACHGYTLSMDVYMAIHLLSLHAHKSL